MSRHLELWVASAFTLAAAPAMAVTPSAGQFKAAIAHDCPTFTLAQSLSRCHGFRDVENEAVCTFRGAVAVKPYLTEIALSWDGRIWHISDFCPTK